MSEPALEYTPEEVEERARLNLGKNLLKALIEQIRLLERPWQAMPEDQQQAVIDVLAKAINFNVRDAINLITTQNYSAVPGKVESVMFKDGVKAVIKCNKHNQTVHDLADREGESIVIIITDPQAYLESMGEVMPDDNQEPLDLGDPEEGDPLYDEAVELVMKENRASISFIQRKLKIGYNRAARLIEDMEKAGAVSPLKKDGGRDVLTPSTDNKEETADGGQQQQ